MATPANVPAAGGKNPPTNPTQPPQQPAATAPKVQLPPGSSASSNQPAKAGAKSKPQFDLSKKSLPHFLPPKDELMRKRIVVACRVRPMFMEEIKNGYQRIIRKGDNGSIRIMEPAPGYQEIPFNFDLAYFSKHGSAKAQYKVCTEIGSVVLNTAWQGYNVSVCAFGASRTGKTFSMFGLGEDHVGLIYRVCDELLWKCRTENNPDIVYEVTFSMFEIYREKIRDLLNSPNEEDEFALQYQRSHNVKKGLFLTMQHQAGLRVRDHPDGPYVEGVTVVPIREARTVKELLEEGECNIQCDHRKIRAAKTPVRGHVVVQIGLTTHETKKTGVHETMESRWCKINFCDLAEREVPKHTAGVDYHQNEVAHVNRSLQCLANCLRGVGQMQSKTGKVSCHFPYRGSPLTMIMKDSFIGFGKVILLSTISPADAHFDQTFSTLQFAQRAYSDRTTALAKRSIKKDLKTLPEMKEELEILLKLEQEKRITLEEELSKCKKHHAEMMAKLREELIAQRALAHKFEDIKKENELLRSQQKALAQQQTEAIAKQEAYGHAALFDQRQQLLAELAALG
eukprot:gnl/Spiro4/757_TR417_c0_g1_i1.p1 gnl/Spiro4/757_TR417_c0_g1~~gnl/Spiro4/757_TR417_c0_g1_i1.p1  ORF type:complete len:567 (-),score=144.87 gnl/Spiro4/757_TR417_c0_g1_i1:65-1765(-)